ncbi:hypothetical protein HY385_01670 [Candidatus Daviesbacteria bacterium]|nr:hypothetical protein [Candidatus Daviesbacteria bacterium]
MKKSEVSLVIAAVGSEKKMLHECILSASDLAQEIIIFLLGTNKDDLIFPDYLNIRYVNCEKVPFVELIRNKMIKSARNEWVLLLDPDERIVKRLSEKLKEVVKIDKFSAVNIPRKNIFFGKWIRHSNWWPDRQIRFFKKNKVSWSEKIHSYARVSGKILDLPPQDEYALEHYGYKSVKEFIDRHKRYACVEATLRRAEFKKPTLVYLFWWPARQFLVRFIRHVGFLDGLYGILLTLLMMKFEVDVWFKMREV